MKYLINESNFGALDSKVHDIVLGVASRVANRRAAGDEQFALDPITMIMIANCVLNVIRLLYVCSSKKHERVLQKMTNPSWFDELLIRGQINKHVPSSLNRMRKDVYVSIMDQSEDLSGEDVSSLLDVYSSGQVFSRSNSEN